MSDYYSSLSPLFRRSSPFVPPNFFVDDVDEAESAATEADSPPIPPALEEITNSTRVLVVGAGKSPILSFLLSIVCLLTVLFCIVSCV